jgi:hypothetical protein
VRAREAGILPKGVRFQVCLPTPYAVVSAHIAPDARAAVEPEYERAMLGEVAKICAEIPHRDLAIQWDVCIEMVAFDGRWRIPRFAGIERAFGDRFKRLSTAVPDDVQLGFHLCYGDWEGRHFIEPENAARMTELANLIGSSAGRPIEFIHMPVPIERDDDAFYAPLQALQLDKQTELFLGLVHPKDGVAGTTKRMGVASKYVGEFGIATECGISRNRSPDVVHEIFKVHAGAAGKGTKG